MFAFATPMLSAFGSEVKTTLQPSRILMGEHVALSFEVDVEIEGQLQMPVFNEQINDKVEILHYGSLDTLVSEKPGHHLLRRFLRITSWEEGLHPIAPFTFLMIQGEDTLSLESEPVLLEVVPFDIEEHADLKDIKDLASAPLTLREILPWFLLWLAIAAIAVATVLYLRKRKNKPQPLTIWQKPEIPAHVAAFNSLEKLKERKLWQQGKVKEYYSELTDILRMYLHKRYGIIAMEMTTAETLHAVKGYIEQNQAFEILEQELQMGDLVKFAKYMPHERDNGLMLDDAFVFVKLTMLKETVEVKPRKPQSED